MVVGGRRSRRDAAFQAAPRVYSDYRAMLKEKDLDLVIIDTPDSLARAAMIEAVKSASTSGCKANQRRCVEGSDARRGAEVQAGRAGRHAAGSTPHLVQARNDSSKQAISATSRTPRSTATTTCARAEPARRPTPRQPRLRDVTGAAPMRPTTPRPPRAGALVWSTQRHHGRHVRPHVERCAGCSISDAESHRVEGASSSTKEQGEHCRHADGDVPLRQPARRLDASRWGSTPDDDYPWARRSRRQGTQGEPDELYFIPQAKGREAGQGRWTYESSSIPKIEPRRISCVTSRRRFAPTSEFLECIESRGTPVADIEGRLHLGGRPHPC